MGQKQNQYNDVNLKRQIAERDYFDFHAFQTNLFIIWPNNNTNPRQQMRALRFN